MPRQAERAAAAIEEALALLDAVTAGELLAALPPQAIDRERHCAGVRLVEMARERLAAAGRRAPQD